MSLTQFWNVFVLIFHGVILVLGSITFAGLFSAYVRRIPRKVLPPDIQCRIGLDNFRRFGDNLICLREPCGIIVGPEVHH